MSYPISVLAIIVYIYIGITFNKRILSSKIFEISNYIEMLFEITKDQS